MGKLKPIGSEKLQGMDKLRRIMEIARFNENIPERVNENSSEEYGITLADGYQYNIVKEKNGYVIKKGINESSLDYIEPMKGRKYYSSYSQALKRLNLITKEVNLLEGNNKNISLFKEGDEMGKKIFLKLNKDKDTSKVESKEQATPGSAPAPAPVPAPVPAPAPTTGDTSQQMAGMDTLPDMTPEEGGQTPESPEGEFTSDSPEMPTPDSDASDEGGQEETVTFKTIQKLTGRLGQKLRKLNSDEEGQMSSKDIKYVINSILSALNLEDLDDDDRESIMNKIEGEEMESDEEGMSDDEMSDNEDDMNLSEPGMEDEQTPGEEVTPEPPSEPTPPMKEYTSIDEDQSFLFTPNKKMGSNESYNQVEEMIEGIFSESKVDKIIRRYFKITESEKKQIKSKRKVSDLINENSNTLVQKVSALKFFKKYPHAELIGESKNGSLIFKVGSNKIRINYEGDIL